MCLCRYYNASFWHHLYYPLNRNKAVSDGAISFYLDHFVQSRVSKITYGVFCSTLYDPNKADHLERSSTISIFPSGRKYISSGFDVILPKVLYLTISFALLARVYRIRVYRIPRSKKLRSLGNHTPLRENRRMSWRVLLERRSGAIGDSLLTRSGRTSMQVS